MPEPQAHPQYPRLRRVALHTLIAGVMLMLLKFAVFGLTNSAAVLSDAMESIVNVIAAALMAYSIWLSNRPADRDHPYGHGKVEFMAIGFEGFMILVAGLVIAVEAVRRLIGRIEPQELTFGISALVVVCLLSLALAIYVYSSGKKLQSEPLIASGKHLFTDVFSTLGAIVGLWLVQYTQRAWLDPLIAMIMAGAILFTSWRLVWHSIDGLMDRSDPADDAAISAILDEQIAQGVIRGYHKVRHRHTGAFHWVDMHLQVNGDMSVHDSHALASRIEKLIEDKLGQANATAHVEPHHTPKEVKP